MDAPAESEFVRLLVVGIGLLLLVGGALVLFVVTYQKRLLQQQLRQRAAEAEYQQQLLAAVIEAQEHERERIGRDLHDGIGATLATTRLLMGRLETNSQATADAEESNLYGMVNELMGTAVHDVRSISHSLFPAVLSRYGLAEALQHLVDVSNETGALDVELEVDYPQPLPLAQELALYRICQELIHNALKHAKGATRLDVLLRQRGPLLTLVVEDDGCGLPASHGPAGPALIKGAGLRSIDVRVQMLRARLRQESEPGQGLRTLVEVQAPVAAA
jgi:two-component system NarL family sensor kinase